MAKPIPVFKFAFAAYAAAGAVAVREQRGALTRKSGKQARFLKSWSVFSSEGGLMVKIGVRDGERCEAITGPKDDCDDYREVWLAEIRESASAFSGVVRAGKVSLRHIRPGQRIGFDPTHILDWAIGCGPGDHCPPDCAAETLCEFVSS